LLGAGGAVDAAGASVEVENLLKRNRLITTGDGRYSLFNPKTNQPVLGANGKELVIDVNKIITKPRINDSEIRNSNRGF
jgi:hypothetical protein